jgi:predicted  nucleic acid-binding Zn-ribbon protein
MKKLFLTATVSLYLIGCNMNPSKEARIQKLETEIQHAMDEIRALENRVQTLEDTNGKLNTRVPDLEKQ